MMDSKYIEIASLMLRGSIYASQGDILINGMSLMKAIALLEAGYIENGKIRIVILEEEK